jgi:hypothetical protein
MKEKDPSIFYDHIASVCYTACESCKKTLQSDHCDEDDFAEYLQSEGWRVIDDKLFCKKCSKGKK